MIYFNCRSIIHALSSKTGDLIGTFDDHSAPVTSMRQIISSDHNTLQVVSSSVDGTLCLWNLVSASTNDVYLVILLIQKSFKLVRSYKIGAPIFNTVVVPGVVDIFSLLRNKGSSNKTPKNSSGSSEVFLVISSGSDDKPGDICTVKTVAFDLLTEKVSLHLIVYCQYLRFF